MLKKILVFTSFISIVSMAQPVIDGVVSDAHYTIVGSYTSEQNGFGNDNDLGTLKFYADGTNMYIGITGEMTSNDNIVLFFNFSGYGGRTGTLAGSGSSTAGVFRTSLTAGDYGLDGATMDMDVDYALAFNEGGASTNLYLDAARFGTTGYLNSGYVGSSDQSGNSAVHSGISTLFGGTGSIEFAYKNDFSVNNDHGVEIMIPISAFSGVNASQTVQLFALITSSAGYISNECIPGDLGVSNLGNDANLGSVGTQDLFTSALSLPVELSGLNGTAMNGKVRLTWSTKTEVNNAGFEIQRLEKSVWNNVGFVQGHGTTNTSHDYSYTDSPNGPGKYFYRLKQIDRDGKFIFSDQIESEVGLTAQDYSLSQNYPNPFNPTTNISFAVKERQFVSLKVYNLVGQEVATLVNGVVEPNSLQTVEFNGKDLSSGIYFYTLTSKDRHEVRKLMLMK